MYNGNNKIITPVMVVTTSEMRVCCG